MSRDQLIEQSPARAVWETLKLSRLQVFASGVVSAGIVGTDAMSEAFRFALLDERQQLITIAVTLFFATWILSRTINATLCALDEGLFNDKNLAGMLSRTVADLIAGLPAIASAVCLLNIWNGWHDTGDAGVSQANAMAQIAALDPAISPLIFGLGLLAIGTIGVALGRVNIDTDSNEGQLVFSLRALSAFWLLGVSIIVIFGFTRLAVEVANYIALLLQKLGGEGASKNIDEYFLANAVLSLSLVIAIIHLTELFFTVLQKDPETKLRNPILRFVENRWLEFPLLVPALGFTLFFAMDPSSFENAFLVLIVGAPPYGFLLRWFHFRAASQSTRDWISKLITSCPLLPISVPLGGSLFLALKLIQAPGEIDPMAATVQWLGPITIVVLGLLPIGWFKLNPFVKIQARTAHLQDSPPGDWEAGSSPFRLPASIRTALDHLSNLAPGVQRSLVAALFAGTTISFFFITHDLLFPPDTVLSSHTIIEIERALGPVSVAFLWCGSAIAFFYLLSFFADSMRVPLVSFAVVWGVGLSILVWNDNHRIAGTHATQPCDPENPWCYPIPEIRKAIQVGDEFHFDKWLAARRDLDDYDDYPVFIVATEGGGIRSAYFTATVLAAIQDSCPRFAEHVVGITSVSGGSLGAAVFAASVSSMGSKAKILPQCLGPLAAPATRGFARVAKETFASDLLTPALVGSLFADAFQRIIPAEVPEWDRALKLERALNAAFERSIDQECAQCEGSLDVGLLTLTAEEHSPPELFFNITEVETGEPGVLSTKNLDLLESYEKSKFANIGLSNGKFSDLSQVSLVTAAVLSARFPYFAPAGKLENRNGWDRRFVDGGYFENSGTWAARALSDKILRDAKSWQGSGEPSVKDRRISIHLIVIQSTPQNEITDCLKQKRTRKVPAKNGDKPFGGFFESGDTGGKPEQAQSAYYLIETEDGRRCRPVLAGFETANEVMSPIRALLNTRVARSDLSLLELNAYANTARVLQASQIENSEPVDARTPKGSIQTSPQKRRAAEIDVKVHSLDLSKTNSKLFDQHVPLTWNLSSRARGFLDDAVTSLMTTQTAAGPEDRGLAQEHEGAVQILALLAGTKTTTPEQPKQ